MSTKGHPSRGAKTDIDTSDGQQLRVYFESLRGQLASDRATWDPHWGDLADFFSPRSPSWDWSDTNIGDRRDFDIINETAIDCRRTLAAGMASGMTPQGSKWWAMGPADDDSEEDLEVRAFCDEVEKRVRKVHLKSNVYASLLNMFDEEGFIGTSAFLVMPDPKTVIRCYEYQVGRYYLWLDNTRRVAGIMRILYMTVSQIVDEFGFDNCSSSVKTLYTAPAGGNKETRQPVVHVIYKGDYFSQEKPSKWPWCSVYYEMSSQDSKTGLLRESGFLENPVMVGRWRVVGENTYAESPGMDCLGSTMSLQAWEERIAQAVEKQVNPPTVASTAVDPRKLSTLPGDVIFVDSKDTKGAFTAAYQVDFRVEGGVKILERIENRIEHLMYKALFQTVTRADRDKTAEEVRALQQEQMHILGPVVERNVEEVLAPLIMRTLGIMERAGMLPPIPKGMKNQDGSVKKFKLEFVSILAKAQKMASMNNIAQFVGFAGQEAALNQGVMDNIDMDEGIRIYGDLADVPAKMMRSKEQVAQIRADKQRAQQQQMLAENADKLANAASVAGNAIPQDGSLLEKVMPGIAR